MNAPRVSRFVRHLFVSLVLASIGLMGSARADSEVPAKLQAQLIGKLATFDRNLPARAAGTVKVLILYRGGDGNSTRIANEIARALTAMSDIAGLPKDVKSQAFVSAADTAQSCKNQHYSIIYVAPGLESDMNGIASALAGVSIMTIGPAGAAIRFELQESKPRVVVNLARAKGNNVSLRSEILKLVRIE